MSTLATQGISDMPYVFGTMDTSGNASTYHIDVRGKKLHTIAFTIADISTNAVVRMEGSNDASGNRWFNMSAYDLTVTANGTYQISEFGAVLFLRPYFVSRTTATTGTLTNVCYFGR